MAGSREGSPAFAPTLDCLPACVLQQVLARMPLADCARAACACKALAHAAAAAAARVTRLPSAAEWGLEQPSAQAVDFARRACCKLQLVWLGPGANDEHIFALRRCVRACCAVALPCSTPGWRQKALAVLSAAPHPLRRRHLLR